MKKIVRCARVGLGIVSIAVMIVGLAWQGAAAASSEIDLMEQTLEDISDLREKMSQKMTEATQIHRRLDDQARELKAEILEEKKRKGVKNFKSASQVPRIHFNLKLLQKLLAYMQELESKIVYYQTGNQRLEYLLIQAQDDLKIIKTLRNLDVQELLIQANEAIAIYQPTIQGHMMDRADITLPPVEAIWGRAVQSD